MPESRMRRKSTFTAPPPKSAGPKPNAPWFAPVMVGFLLLGLAWIVCYYLTQAKYPVPSVGDWNLGIGIGLMLVGFGMLTRWR